jgi:hypothetical protein
MKNMQKFHYKGIQNLKEFSLKAELHALENSVYREWYEFARLSPVLWSSYQFNLKIKDDTIKKVSADFNNLWGKNFKTWATENARYLFAEQVLFEQITLLDHSEEKSFHSTQKKIVIAVPLTIRKGEIVKQFREMLNEHHLGMKLNVLDVSHSANYKIFNLQFRKNVLLNERLVLVYRWLFPKTPMWVIADRLQLSPSNKARFEVGFQVPSVHKNSFHRLNSIGGRHLFKARRRVLNAERGSFPNASNLASSTLSAFFKSNHDEYISLTFGQKGTEKTHWRKWIEKNYFTFLKKIVLERNDLTASRLTDRDVKNFMSGKTNHF